MSIDPQLFVAKFREILGALAALIIGKTVLFAAVGRLFGLSTIAAIRAGLLLAPGGEFAFVAFGEAVNQVGFVIFNVTVHKILVHDNKLSKMQRIHKKLRLFFCFVFSFEELIAETNYHICIDHCTFSSVSDCNREL